MNVSALRKTPLFDRHKALGARIVPFAGYEMPVQYAGVLEECLQTRRAAGLFDVSHMGQFRLRGTRVREELNALVSNDIERLKAGQAQYSLLCDPQGGILDDLVIYRISDEEFFICVNASNRLKDAAWMRDHLKHSEFVDESEATALIAIQGPRAENILKRLGDADTVSTLKYYWGTAWAALGKSCYLSRTGYTGEDGFEIYCPSRDAVALWDALLEAGQPDGIWPVGLGARDTLRIEMGYPLHGKEISDTIDGLSAGLSWVIRLDKPQGFIGQDSLRGIADKGPASKLIALTVEDRRIPRSGYELQNRGGAKIGSVTSGTFSPHLQKPIALAFVDSASATDGEFFVRVREDRIPAARTRLPFVASKTKSEKKAAKG